MRNPRLCLYCEHFDFDPGSPGYSEYTPGTDMRIGCDYGHWNVQNGDPNVRYLRVLMERAATCEDFTEVAP